MEALKAEELRKLQRDRRVLEKQSRALLKLPTKREKEEIQALEVRRSTVCPKLPSLAGAPWLSDFVGDVGFEAISEVLRLANSAAGQLEI